MTPWDSWRALARVLVGDPELTGAEVALQSGVDPEQVRRLWQALGFPPIPDDERLFSRSDVAVLQGARSFVERQGTDPEVLIQLTRVIGQSLARIAEAQVAASVDRLAPIGSGAAPDAVAVQTVIDRVTLLSSSLEPVLGYVWRRHLLAALLRFAATAEHQSGAGRTLAVGFADLVDFTAISQELSEHELATMVDRFEAVAYAHIPDRGGRIIKMIGDEVMFAVESAPAAAEIALALVEACAADDALPDARVGLAKGSTLSWEGDLFGPTVNLASRLVNLARPGSVLVSEELGEELQAQPAFALHRLRPSHLKGIGRVPAYVLRREGTDSGRGRRLLKRPR
jgi:adenylate cyclase